MHNSKFSPPACAYCDHTDCPEDACLRIFTPIRDCIHKHADYGCCSHPENFTPECHVHACPLLSPELRAFYDRACTALDAK